MIDYLVILESIIIIISGFSFYIDEKGIHYPGIQDISVG